MIANKVSSRRPLATMVGVFIACGASNAPAMPGAHDARPTLSPTSVDLGASHVGDNVSTGLTVFNAAPSGSDGATAEFVATTGNVSTNNGQIIGLAPGASDDSSLQVGVDTSSAGHRSGVATVALGSDGAISGEPKNLDTVDVAVQGDVFRLARPEIGEFASGTIFPPVDQLPNGDVVISTEDVAIHQTVYATVSIGNTATNDGFSEKLNATLGQLSEGLSTNFSGITGMAPGEQIVHGITLTLDTSTSGSVGGTATIDFVSDGAGIDGLGPTELGSRKIFFETTVYGDAKGVVSPRSLELNARIGDTVEDYIDVENMPDIHYAVPMDAWVDAYGDARLPGDWEFTAIYPGMAVSVPVSVDTSTAGPRHGHVTIDMNSNGEPFSVHLYSSLGSVSVDVDGKVYAPAVAEVADSGGVDFGILHPGDFVTHDIVVRNAASGALTDVLKGGVGRVSGPFEGEGDLGNGLAAGDTASSQLRVSFQATETGLHEGSARLEFSSHNEDMTDLALDAIDIALRAQVNAHANPVFSTNGGVFVRGSGPEYLLDFGAVDLGESVSSGLAVFNELVTGNDIDLLDGSFDLTGAGVFSLFGFDSFVDFTAPDLGGRVLEPWVALDTAGLAPGVVEGSVILRARGHNASGFSEDFAPIRLRLRARIIPLPGTLLLLLTGSIVGGYRLRRDRGTPAAHGYQGYPQNQGSQNQGSW